MSRLKIPDGPGELTPEWLTEALRQTGTISNAAVKSFEASTIGEGTGFMGQLANVALTYDPPEEGAPRSLIAKLPTHAPENREIADTFHFYEIETRFYEQIANDVELRTPRCYYSHVDTQTGDFVLLLEDLAPACVGDQVAGCTPEQAELAIRELAKFHATWWESRRLGELDWMPFTNEPARAQSAQENYQEAWEPFLEQFRDEVPPHVLEVGERFGRSVTKLMDQMSQPPRTIMHGDYRLDNLFFAGPDGGDPLAVIDWQICSRGRGLFDVAYFMTGTLEPDARKAREMDLLRMYHGILTGHGVNDYSFDQCLLDYRISSLFCWLYAVIDLGRLDLANERGMDLFMTILKRASAAISDLDAGELIPD